MGAFRPALEPLRGERELRLPISSMEDIRIGAPTEQKRNIILVRSEGL